MKRIATVFLLTILFAATANAQPQPQPWRGAGWGPPDAGERVERLSMRLDLSDEQVDQLLEIFDAADAEREAIWEAHRSQIEPELCALRENVHDQVSGILTEEQAAEFEQVAGQRHKVRGRRGPRHGPPPLDCARYGG